MLGLKSFFKPVVQKIAEQSDCSNSKPPKNDFVSAPEIGIITQSDVIDMCTPSTPVIAVADVPCEAKVIGANVITGECGSKSDDISSVANVIPEKSKPLIKLHPFFGGQAPSLQQKPERVEILTDVNVVLTNTNIEAEIIDVNAIDEGDNCNGFKTEKTVPTGIRTSARVEKLAAAAAVKEKENAAIIQQSNNSNNRKPNKDPPAHIFLSKVSDY